MSALHKYLNEKPSMCDLQFNTDRAHTQRTFCSHNAYLGLWPISLEMSKKLLGTSNFSNFLFYHGTLFFCSEVSVLIYFSCQKCYMTSIRYTDIRTACRRQVAHTLALSKSFPESECVDFKDHTCWEIYMKILSWTFLSPLSLTVFPMCYYFRFCFIYFGVNATEIY